MGQECVCQVRYGEEAGEGRALLESAALIVRGGVRFAIPFTAMKRVDARGEQLVIRTAAGEATLDLGARRAATWARKILSPPTLLEKLGVKPGLRVGLVGLTAADLPEAPGVGPAAFVTGRALKECALILCAVDAAADLARLPRLRAALRPDGGLWMIYRKGVRTFGEDDVRAAARQNGLVDVKVAAFSATHSALKLMIPKAAR